MTIKYDIPAIETEYKGRFYRSILEAKWAVFFSLLGWRYEYEPFECKGWLPDFALFGDRTILVEVKPIIEPNKIIMEKMEKGDREDHELLLLGISPFRFYENDMQLGWLGERHEESDTVDWNSAVMGIWLGPESVNQNSKKKIGFCSDSGSFRDRITGNYDGGCYGARELNPEYIEKLWAKAGNEVRYLAKK